ncbi:u3 small nucleolar RNA-associated protein 6 homolog [Trichonephila inaurata madagascariensis]|uniref:U3 small nucleolar RNA-associated protein 6 homolog n=1 Tax=Trichonephila inaurata madagascariensis TaxID=2747483 RepID=A0A8X6X710_9ARAC|nr:u3 small nucleolar RNA-associated protein 6 homolog [Trichonephila inaurata madagascariensis]
MERIELFNINEIKSIIRRRKSLMYKLQRMQKSKEIYLKYIEYETSLLKLIEKRRKRLVIEDKRKEIDFSIAKRICRLFREAKKRFPADEKLWLDDIEFSKTMKWFDTISVLYSKLLQVHSQNPSLWIMAAKWEMEEIKSPDNARKIFQRGVLLHPTSDTLWREFFRMELMYIDLIRKRRAILEPQSLKSIEAEDDIILNGQIAYIVYDKAVEAINDVEFALSFIQICLEFEFGYTFIENILKYVSEKFPDKEETFDAFAKKPLLNVEEKIKAGKEMGVKKKVILEEINKEILTKYEEAIKVLPTEKMWRFYIDFIFTLLESAKERKKAKLQNMAIDLMKAAAALDCLSVSYYSNLVDLLFERGDTEEALTTSLTSARKWNTVDLWYKCLTYHIQCMREFTEIYDLLEEALNSVNVKDSVTLWKLGVDWLSITSPEKLIELFEKGICKRKEISVPVKEMYLEICALKNGVTEARSLYKRFKKMGSLMPPIVKKMIRIEKAQLDVPIKALREYFEDGVREFGSEDIDIWMDYLELEIRHGDRSLSSYDDLLWRAKKTLKPEYVFEFQQRLININSDVHQNMLHAY